MNYILDESYITHSTKSLLENTKETSAIVGNIKDRLRETPNLVLPLQKTLQLVDQLSEFPLGRFLLHNKGLNGFWTSYIFNSSSEDRKNHPLENWLLNNSILTSARERFFRFKKILQSYVRSDITMCSVPCGLMDELLSLDYSTIDNFQLVGIDIDDESIEYARKNAIKQNLINNVNFIQRDAWRLDITSRFDLLTSNGLNMYESDEKRLIALYKNFRKALKNDGILVLSYIPTPPKNANDELMAQLFGMTVEDFKLERSIFTDIIQVTYLNFCSDEALKHQLEAAGFSLLNIQYNQNGVSPIAIAQAK